MKILLASFMRLNSERVPNKLLATVGEASLAEIMLTKLVRLREEFHYAIDVALAACATDKALVSIAERLNCPVVERSALSRDGETYETIYGELRGRLAELGFGRLIVVNPCQPFLRWETIAAFVRPEVADPQRYPGPRVAVLRNRGWVWNQDFELICGDDTPNTKSSPEYFVLSHAMYSYPVDVLGMPAQMKFRHFAPLEAGPELIDIDTPEDLHVARCFAAGRSQLETGAGGVK